MPSRVITLCALLIAIATAAPNARADEGDTDRLTIFPVAGELSPSDRRLIDAMLLSELRRRKSLELVPEDVRQVHVEATSSLGIACGPGEESSLACARHVGNLAGARWTLLPSASQTDTEERALGLVLVSTKDGRALREVTMMLPPTGESLSSVLRAGIDELFTGLLPESAAPVAAAPPASEAPTPEPSSGGAAAWWIGGGAAIVVGAALLALSAGSFALGGAEASRALKAGEDPDERLAIRDAWYAGGITMAALGGLALLGGAGAAAYGTLVADE